MESACVEEELVLGTQKRHARSTSPRRKPKGKRIIRVAGDSPKKELLKIGHLGKSET
jgi:hypothetical protein